MYNEQLDRVVLTQECSFGRAVEAAAPVLAAPAGSALGVPYASRMQVHTTMQPCLLTSHAAHVVAMLAIVDNFRFWALEPEALGPGH